jgi:hypothetical protein
MNRLAIIPLLALAGCYGKPEEATTLSEDFTVEDPDGGEAMTNRRTYALIFAALSVFWFAVSAIGWWRLA